MIRDSCGSVSCSICGAKLWKLFSVLKFPASFFRLENQRETRIVPGVSAVIPVETIIGNPDPSLIGVEA